MLIADEAHHLNSGTKSGNLFGSWEETVLQILHQNFDNILLEFTATLDYESREIVNKYKDRVSKISDEFEEELKENGFDYGMSIIDLKGVINV